MTSSNKLPQQPSTDVFAAIAHPVRREILDRLSEDDLTVKRLSEQFAISRPAVSQHLAILLEAGLVTRQTEGRQNYYHLQPDALQEVDKWVRHYQRFWDRKLDKLGNYLQRKHGTNSDEA